LTSEIVIYKQAGIWLNVIGWKGLNAWQMMQKSSPKKQTRMLINLSVNIQNWTTDQTLSSLLMAHIRKHWLFFLLTMQSYQWMKKTWSF